jgi:hypothetical protein
MIRVFKDGMVEGRMESGGQRGLRMAYISAKPSHMLTKVKEKLTMMKQL